MSKIIRKVIKQGNSFAVTIPKGYLDYIGAESGSYVVLSLRHPKEIIITPGEPKTDLWKDKKGE